MNGSINQIIFSLNSLSLFLPFSLSFWSSPHPRTKKPRVSWPPPQKGKKRGTRNQRPPFVHAPILSAPSWPPKKSSRSFFVKFFGGFIKSASRSQKMDFRSGGEGVQSKERNLTDRIYKATETKKAVLLQRV